MVDKLYRMTHAPPRAFARTIKNSVQAHSNVILRLSVTKGLAIRVKQNKFRNFLQQGLPTIGTRILSRWPVITEAVASTGMFDYIEFVAEYAPFSQSELENVCCAAELHNISTMIKVDFQNRAYVAQKAMASGFQAILFTDHKTAEEVRESLHFIRPDTPEDGGRFGYPNRRWIGYEPYLPQMDHAQRVRDTVAAFMIEKKEALDNIEEICSVPGVDMVQFGPSDYSLNCGFNASQYREEYKLAERKMIEAALRHNVRPRCEIDTAQEAEYYINLGVKDFCLGDELRNNMTYWNTYGGQLKSLVEQIKY